MKFDINKVAVLGAGVMGAGIAAHLAGAGISVCLLDIVPKELTEKEKSKGLTLDSKSVRNRFAQNGKNNVVNPKARSIYDSDLGELIAVGNFTDDLSCIKSCDWIIEVIVENLDVKKRFMKDIEKHRTPGTIITSNTSGVSINSIVEDMPSEFKNHFLGTHFFNPPRYMKLFELIPNKETAPELVTFLAEFGTHRLGKGVVMAKDTPNFVGNRIGTYAIANTVNLMEKYQFDFGKVDQLTGPVIGRPKSATFRTIDMVGLDIFKHVAGNVINAVDDKDEAESFKLPEYMSEMIKNGQLGNKTKQGIYKRTKGPNGKQTLVWDRVDSKYVAQRTEKSQLVKSAMKSPNKYKSMIDGNDVENKFTWELIKNVLIYSASKVPEIADDYKEIDKAMRWGFNWEMGPFEIWDKIGVESSVQRMTDEGQKVPKWVSERLANNEMTFYDQDQTQGAYISLRSDGLKVIKENEGASLVDLGDGVACLNFKSKANAITDSVMDMIFEAVEEVEKNYKGLVIGNQSNNFSVGADLTLIGGLAKEKKWSTLEGIVDKFQRANMAIKYSKKPVVAAPYGMTLGGGAEIALHSHSISAHAETYMGLVEAGVGLLPGGGGTKELLLRSIENLGKVNNGEMISHVKKAWETIAMAKVSGSAHESIKNGTMRKSDHIVMNNDYLIDRAKEQVIQMSDHFIPLKKKNVKVLGTTGMAAIQYVADFMLKGGFISEHDKVIADKIAYVLTGGNVAVGTYLTEEQVLNLEKEAFVSLCKEEKTQMRIEHMLKTGKALRN